MDTPKAVDSLKVALFADGADVSSMRSLAANPLIKGFTTNPTLMRKAGVTDYTRFAREAVAIANPRPISFEVLADDFDEMEAQARIITTWGTNVFVKIPITDSRGESSASLLAKLARLGIRLNVTALLTLDQVHLVADTLRNVPAGYVSVFAGRIADTGRDPVPLMRAAVEVLTGTHLQLIWASPRELLNVYQAEAIGCHVITITPDIVGKFSVVGRSLGEYSLETVRMFLSDAIAAGYAINQSTNALAV